MSLRFKGDAPKKKKRKERPGGGKADDDDGEDDPQIADYSSDPVSGTGALMSSGVVVMGLDTDFIKELEVGGTLLVTVNDRFRNSSTDEARVVNMVLGKSSLNVNAPFSCDITTAAPFMFVKKQPDIEKLRAAKHEQKRKEKERDEESRQVSYKVIVASSGTFKRWETVTQSGASMSREQMLDLRAKNKTDRHAR